jgi:thioredoxin 1
LGTARYLLVLVPLLLGLSPERRGSEAIFDENADAHRLVRSAIAEASRTHKHVILDFGANWCYDCHVLEEQMRTPELAPLIDKNFVVVDIDVGKFDKNLDLAEKYQVPLKKGIPALAVLDPHGKLLYAQDQGQFESARWLKYEEIKEFFEKWKPRR